MLVITKRTAFVGLMLTLLVVCSCAVRSISDSGYRQDSRYGRQSDNPFYRGELSEFDVIGIETSGNVTEEQIQRALATRSDINIRKGTSIMLVQSGALMPDDQMTQGMERYYKVSVFSGVPTESHEEEVYSKKLRLAAARAGCEYIPCYWGLLETAKEKLGIKTVSWVPIVGSVLPDEKQKMRIRLKVAVVDVRLGSSVTLNQPFSFTKS